MSIVEKILSDINQFFLILLLHLRFCMIISTDPIHIVLLSAFVLMAIIQAWYYLAYYRRATNSPSTQQTPESEPSAAALAETTPTLATPSGAKATAATGTTAAHAAKHIPDKELPPLSVIICA